MSEHLKTPLGSVQNNIPVLTTEEQRKLFDMAVDLAGVFGCVNQALHSLLAAKAKLDSLGDGSSSF